MWGHRESHLYAPQPGHTVVFQALRSTIPCFILQMTFKKDSKIAILEQRVNMEARDARRRSIGSSVSAFIAEP